MDVVGQAWSATSLALLRYPPPHVTALAPGGVLAGVGGTEITVRGSGLLGTEDWPELSPECRLVGAEDAATAYASETAARATCVLVGGAFIGGSNLALGALEATCLAS